MRVQKHTVFATVAGTIISFLALLLCMYTGNINTMFLGIVLGIFTGYFVTLLMSASSYRAHRHKILSEMMMLLTQTKSICNQLRCAENYAFTDKVDLLLQSYHKIKNHYVLLIQQVLDYDPISKKLANRIITYSEEIHELEARLKLQLRMNELNMNSTFPALLSSLPFASIEEMESSIAKRILNAKQLKLYRSVEQTCGDLLDSEQTLAGIR